MVDSTEISQYCASRLVNYKCPSEVRVVERLPVTTAHKPDHESLRRAARGEQGLSQPHGLVKEERRKRHETSEKPFPGCSVVTIISKSEPAVAGGEYNG
jgi:hypothetical protein